MHNRGVACAELSFVTRNRFSCVVGFLLFILENARLSANMKIASHWHQRLWIVHVPVLCPFCTRSRYWRSMKILFFKKVKEKKKRKLKQRNSQTDVNYSLISHLRIRFKNVVFIAAGQLCDSRSTSINTNSKWCANHVWILQRTWARIHWANIKLFPASCECIHSVG